MNNYTVAVHKEYIQFHMFACSLVFRYPMNTRVHAHTHTLTHAHTHIAISKPGEIFAQELLS